MKFWELTSLLRDEQELIKGAARADPRWSHIEDWLDELPRLVNNQTRADLDSLLDRDYVRAALSGSSKFYVLEPDKVLRSARRSPPGERLSALEAFDRYGGAALEDVEESGSASLK